MTHRWRRLEAARTAGSRMWSVFRGCALVCLASCAAKAGPIRYSFEAATRDSVGSPSHIEMFRLQLPDFVPVVANGPVVSFLADDPGVASCLACKQPPLSAFHFLRGGSGDSIQFQDADGTGRFYLFSPNVFSSVGTYSTQPGINVNVGTLVVTAVPEPSSVSLVLAALGCGGIGWFRRRGLARS